MLVAPSVHHLSAESGALSGRTGRYEKRLSDLMGLYGDTEAWAAACAAGDRVVYAVEDVRPGAMRGGLIFGTTWMAPGRIGAEFFMTRGHIHAIANRPEIYRGEAGHGLMVMEAPDGGIETREVVAGATVYVPPYWIHRSVNLGDAPLVMSFAYPADAGQDYGIIKRSNGMAVRIVADGAGWKAVPNPDHRPRTAVETAAIHATGDGEMFDELARHGVVPVITLDDAAAALALADALMAGGLPVAEITFRTAAARDTIAAIVAHRPGMIVGAGTVLSEEQVDAAQAAGARFALSPGLDSAVLAHAAAQGLPFAPGIMTPTDLQAALRAGCRMVKFFPAMAAGGPAMLKNIAAPYAQTGIGFNPTGGVMIENMGDWLALPEVRAVGGTWIATRADIAAGNWEKIAANARAAVAKVAAIRAGK